MKVSEANFIQDVTNNREMSSPINLSNSLTSNNYKMTHVPQGAGDNNMYFF